MTSPTAINWSEGVTVGEGVEVGVVGEGEGSGVGRGGVCVVVAVGGAVEGVGVNSETILVIASTGVVPSGVGPCPHAAINTTTHHQAASDLFNITLVFGFLAD